jgi:hypothetical protein
VGLVAQMIAPAIDLLIDIVAVYLLKTNCLTSGILVTDFEW